MKLGCGYNNDLAKEHEIGAFLAIESTVYWLQYIPSKIITSCLNRLATRDKLSVFRFFCMEHM